jgi:membrane protein
MNATAAWDMIKETFSDWSEDRAPRLAAALAYYTVFAIGPLLVIAISVAGLVLGSEDSARQSVQTEVRGLVGETGAEAINSMIEGARKPAAGIIATVIGIATLLFAASGLFGQLQDALNTIWEVQPDPNRGFWGTVKARFLSFTMVLGVGFLLLVSLLLSTVLSAAVKYVSGDGSEQILWQVVNFVVSFGVTTLLFAAIFKVLPDAKIEWRDVWIGAVATAVLFTLGKFAIGLYLGRAAPESTYGVAGSLVAMLIWVYYSAQILFMGAEFTQVYAKRYGSKIQPDEGAVPITEEARAQQGMPRKEQVAATAQLKERQFGGADIEAEPESAADVRPAQPAAATAPAPAGAVAGFLLGLLMGRRSKSKDQ